MINALAGDEHKWSSYRKHELHYSSQAMKTQMYAWRTGTRILFVL